MLYLGLLAVLDMKKFLFTVAVAAIAGFNVYKANTTIAKVGDLSLNGIEQLAEGESYYRYDCKFVPAQGRCIWTDGAWSICLIEHCH